MRFAIQLSVVLALLLQFAYADTLEKMAYDRRFPEVLEEVEKRLPKATAKERIRLLVLKAECLVSLRRENGEESLKVIDPRKAPARFFRVRGQWQIQQEQHELAGKDFRQALRMEPPDREKLQIRFIWADMESRLGRNDEAFEQLSEALAIIANGEVSKDVWTSYYDYRYYALIRAGQEREAQDTVLLARAHLKSMNNQEGVAWTYYTEAQEHHSARRTLQARKSWEAALSAAPSMKASSLLLWGFNNVFSQDDLDEVRYFAELLDKEWPQELTPFEHYHLRLMQGLLWSKIGEHEKALEYYQLAELQAGTTRSFSGRHLSISLSFHRFNPAKGGSDMELALWSQLKEIDELNYTLQEIADFMEEKQSKLPSSEQAAWLFELGVRLLDSQPLRSAELFQQALQKADPRFRKDFLDAIASAYAKKGRTDAARPYLSALGDEMNALDREDSYKLLSLMASEFVTQMPYRNLWQELSGSRPFPLEAFMAEEIRSRTQLIEDVQEVELKKLGKSAMRWKLAHVYRTKGDLLFVQGRLAEAAAAYEMGGDIQGEDGGKSRLYDRYLGLVYQRLGQQESALRYLRKSRRAYESSDQTESLLYSAAAEIGLLLGMGRAEEALQLAERFLPLAKDENKRAFQFAKVRAFTDMGRFEEAKKGLEQLKFPAQNSEFQVAYQLKLARIYDSLQRDRDAINSLKRAWSIARQLDSPQMEMVVALWRDVDPESTPEVELATTRIEQNRKDDLLSSAEFLRVIDSWMIRDTGMATGLTLLPKAMVARAAMLTEDEALVQYYVGERGLLCMVGTSDGFFVQHLMIDKALLERWIGNFEKDREAAHKIGRVLLEPIASVCSEKTLTLLTHGRLSSLPWDRLEFSKGVLVEHFPWTIWAGEASSSLRLQKKPAFLALGGVKDTKLAASGREVVTLGESLENVLAVLTGLDANLENLNRYLQQADILHIATHSTPEYLQLSDGPLPRKEIYELPLRPGALVVLSSCEGAKPGAQERAPVTLASSLLAAGASQVVASLERVGDEEAESFFLQFYEELKRGLSPVKALQQTKLKRRAEQSKDWYKFVILGG